MQVDMHYWKMCGSGSHVFHENVLGEDRSSKWACLTGLCKNWPHLSCCQFRQLVCFFSSCNSFFFFFLL